MSQRFRIVFWSTLMLALAHAPLSAGAQETQSPAAATLEEAATATATAAPAAPSLPMDAGTAVNDGASPNGQTQLAQSQPAQSPSDISSPRGAVLSPERLQDLKETLAEMQTRLQGAVDTATQAMADGQVTVEVPALLNHDQVQELLNTVSRIRWTLNDAMDVAGDMAVRAGEPQGTLVISTKQMIGIVVGGAGAAVVVDLLGGGGLATATAAVVGAFGGYWAGSPETWTWVNAPQGPSSAPTPDAGPATIPN